MLATPVPKSPQRESSPYQWNDDPAIPDELAGRLYRASEEAALELAATFPPSQRADLAVYCYRKSHLHRIGLMIAATCDQTTLIQLLGTARGRVLFAQSHELMPEVERPRGVHRPRITLATRAGSGRRAPAVETGEAADAS